MRWRTKVIALVVGLAVAIPVLLAILHLSAAAAAVVIAVGVLLVVGGWWADARRARRALRTGRARAAAAPRR